MEFGVPPAADGGTGADVTQIAGDKFIGTVYGKGVPLDAIHAKIGGEQRYPTVVARKAVRNAPGNPHQMAVGHKMADSLHLYVECPRKDVDQLVAAVRMGPEIKLLEPRNANQNFVRRELFDYPGTLRSTSEGVGVNCMVSVLKCNSRTNVIEHLCTTKSRPEK
nr:hypothetical protein [uncultured Alistipes sp.]